MPEDILSKKEAIEYLGIENKEFENYFKSGGEIKGKKVGARFQFKKSDLVCWNDLKKSRIVILNLKEYEKCFNWRKN